MEDVPKSDQDRGLSRFAARHSTRPENAGGIASIHVSKALRRLETGPMFAHGLQWNGLAQRDNVSQVNSNAAIEPLKVRIKLPAGHAGCIAHELP